MKENPSASTPRAPSREQGDSLGKRLARLKTRFIKALAVKLAAAVPPVRDHEFWSSILEREQEKECPADEFRRMSFKLRKAGDLAAAEEICARGIALHPADLRLAVEHAEIARVSGDLQTRITRWQRVVDLGGTQAPVTAFKHLAEGHRVRGDFSKAELIVRQGLELHHADFALMEKLTAVLSSAGRCTDAIAAWRAIIEVHPEKDHAPAYLHISLALRDEGLLERAEQTLRDGLLKYPDNSKLLEALQELTFLRRKPPGPSDGRKPVPTHPLIAHLFQDHLEPSGNGTLGFFMVPSSSLRQHVPAMLDIAECLPPPEKPAQAANIDIFAVWGPPSIQHAPVRELAATLDKPLLYLDSGFLSSPGIEGKDAAAHSVIICPESSYLDATRPSHLETTLNSDEYTLTENQQIRAEKCIASIVSHRLSKFNHAPRIDLRPRFPQDGTRRILLVDQRVGGGSIHWSLGGLGTFERMIEAALALPDHEILVKLHPEVISGNKRSHLLPLLPDPLPSHFTLIDYDVNPFDLFDVIDQVFVCTSQLGFEAAMAGKEVHCFAAPFYTGWGFTQDRIAVPRRNQRRSITEVFHLFHIVHSRYFVPGQGGAEIEDLIDYLIEHKTTDPTQIAVPSPVLPRPAVTPPIPSIHQVKNPLHILIIVHCGRMGASGRYLQNLALSLHRLECEVMVLAEGECIPMENGIPWLAIEFEGTRLSRSLREKITAFGPDIIYQSGVRSRAQRAALELMILTNARFVLQSEDDDIQSYKNQHGESAAAAMSMIDKPILDYSDIAAFFQLNNWHHTLNVLFNPRFDYWIEPVIRALCYRLASLHTAIWHPFENA